jgi:hypothetical protein
VFGPVRAPSSAGVAVLLAGVVAACDASSGERLEWVVEWSDPETADASVAVRYRVLAGRCGGETTLEHRSEWIEEGSGPLAPITLEPGAHCFCVEAQDARCRRVARGCETVDLPRGQPLTLTLEPIAPEPMMCDCHAGHCGDAGAADAGAPEAGRDAGPPEGVDYVVPRAVVPPTIDGACDDFADVAPLPLLGVSTSDNMTDCRFRYVPGAGGDARAELLGCCVVDDTDIRADPTRVRDDEGAWQDDRVETWIRPGPEAVFDDRYVKVTVTAAGAVVDSAYDPVAFEVDSSYFTVVEHREVVDGTLASDGAGDASYTLEFRVELPESAAVAPEDVGRMNVFVGDHDEAGATATMAAGGVGTINDPGVAVRIRFAP